MKTFAAGWSLQKPHENYFKKFLRLNNIALAGIVYPKKVPDDIEGIPVLDFATAQDAVTPDDLVLDTAANFALQKEMQTFFGAKGIQLVSVPDYLDRLIADDRQDALQLPVEGIQSSDIRKLKESPAPSLFDQHFLDPESYQLASTLDGVFRHSEWHHLIGFDRDDTPDSVVFNVLLDLNKQGLLKHLIVLDTPRFFLDAILKLKHYDAKASFTVSVSDAAITDLGGRAEFYRRSLSDCLVPFVADEASRDGKAILLSGSAEPILSAGARSPLSAICLMRRSIIDYVAVRNAFGERQYRILLRQPDTTASNLVAAILTPALYGM
jgi:hypothetical protein